jgi:phage/plasmid-associated DNA primase
MTTKIKENDITWFKNITENGGAQEKAIESLPLQSVLMYSLTKSGRMWGHTTQANFLKKLEQNHGLYEVIHTFPHKVFFDVDENVMVPCFQSFIDNVKQKIENNFPNADFAISGSNTEKKTSLHVVLNNYLIENEEQRKMMKTICKGLGFDSSVYTKNRFMKCINQSKPDGRIQAILECNDFKKHCITHFMGKSLQFPDDLTDNESVGSSSVASVSSVSSNSFTAFYRAIVDNINPELYTEYQDWLLFIGALKNFTNGLDIADEYSQKVDGYVSRDDVEKHMTFNTSIGYLVNLSKKSNPTQHKIIIGSKYLNELVFTEYELSQIAIHLTDDIIKVNDKLYYYDTYWIQDTTDHIRMLLSVSLRSFFKFHHDLQCDLLKTIEPDNEQYSVVKKRIAKYAGIITNLINKSGSGKNILDQFKMYLPNSDIIFDDKPYLFCFKNCAFDLQTGKKYIVKKEDYIIENTGTNYTEKSTEKTILITQLINQIFPDIEIRKTYLSVLYMAMTGIRVEKFFLANGCGRNGKGLINELFMELLGNYGYILPVDILTSKKDIASGANPQIANCHKKRFILSREPEEGSKLRMSTVKEMTGGCEINARQLYSGDCKVTMCQVQMLECNAKPALSGTMNEAILERIVDIPFVSYFTSDTVNKELNIYAINTDYKLPSFQKEYASTLFHILLDYNKLYISPCIKKRSTEYVMGSDDIYTWIKDTYDEGTKDDIVKAVDLFKNYTDSEVYSLMSKEEKRQMTKKKFIELLKSSIAFKGQFFETIKYVGNDKIYDRLHGWKIRVIEVKKETEKDKNDEIKQEQNTHLI